MAKLQNIDVVINNCNLKLMNSVHKKRSVDFAVVIL
jgi:hypothetical protein